VKNKLKLATRDFLLAELSLARMIHEAYVVGEYKKKEACALMLPLLRSVVGVARKKLSFSTILEGFDMEAERFDMLTRSENEAAHAMVDHISRENYEEDIERTIVLYAPKDPLWFVGTIEWLVFETTGTC
jgi:hypothetical protein